MVLEAALRFHLLFSAAISLITGGLVQPPMVVSRKSRRAFSCPLSAPNQMPFTLIPAKLRVDELCPFTHVNLIAYVLLSILVQTPLGLIWKTIFFLIIYCLPPSLRTDT